ncbi:MAG TPA: hypothetical protein VLB74_03310 [Flavobacterium sp.]|uniref:hypothetical protein n=1 Tax=Flavobacterium sp. TaxID=239 RepID=UPI002C77BC69|nr:hypothetical protein [Flavobacterium sp.]HSD13652.1 hypothetical protein [Flavobacterium sp.]
MKTLHGILSEKIFSVTEKIQQNFPGLYEHLDETPFSLKTFDKHGIEDADLIHYLEELIFQMNCSKKSAVDYNTNENIMKNLNDNSESLNENWGEQKEKLLEKYSVLSETDLLFIDGKKEEMLEKVRKILGLTKEELMFMLFRF